MGWNLYSFCCKGDKFTFYLSSVSHQFVEIWTRSYTKWLNGCQTHPHNIQKKTPTLKWKRFISWGFYVGLIHPRSVNPDRSYIRLRSFWHKAESFSRCFHFVVNTVESRFQFNFVRITRNIRVSVGFSRDHFYTR